MFVFTVNGYTAGPVGLRTKKKKASMFTPVSYNDARPVS